MATILRARDFRVVIYSNDHPPPHCHVMNPRGAAKIALGEGPVRPWVMASKRLARQQLKQALELVIEHRELLKRRWSDIHGQ